MLAIGVDLNQDVKGFLESKAEPVTRSRENPSILRAGQHFGAGGGGSRSGLVRRTIVDDKNMRRGICSARLLDDSRDGGFLIMGRDENESSHGDRLPLVTMADSVKW